MDRFAPSPGLHSPAWRRRPWHPQSLLAVALVHGVLLVLWSYAIRPHASVGEVPVALAPTSLRLVVSLLPLAVPPPAAASLVATRESRRDVRAPAASDPPPTQHTAAGGVQVPPASPAAEPRPVDAPRSSATVQWDARTIEGALGEAERGTVRELARKAGRAEVLAPVRGDAVAAAVAKARVRSVHEGSLARIAQEDDCRQELGKSGVGERSWSNDRDTFMPTYMGAGKECKR